MAVHYGNPFVTKLRQAGIGLARTLMCKHAAAAAAAVVAAAAVAAEALSEAVVLDWHASVSQERQEANAKLAESVAAHCGNDVDVIWEYVDCHVITYQKAFLGRDFIIWCARDNPRRPPAVSVHLETAQKKMDQVLKHRRTTGEPIKYTTEEMSQLIKTQNEFIYIELWHVFKTDVAQKLNPKLERFSQDAYDAVAHKLLNETSKQPTPAAATEPTRMDSCNIAGGCNTGRQEGATKPLLPPTHWTISAQSTASEPRVVAGGERRAGDGEVKPCPDLARGEEVYAGGDGGGRSCASAPVEGSGGCGSNIGPHGILVGRTASDQEGGRRQRLGAEIPGRSQKQHAELQEFEDDHSQIAQAVASRCGDNEATWKYVDFHMDKYQEFFLGIGGFIVSCTEDRPRCSCSQPASVHLVLVHLDNARQNMDQSLNEQRRLGLPIEYTAEKMSELTSTQNEFIFSELGHVCRMNLAPKIQHKLDECSHDAYLAVRAKLVMEGRREQLVREWTGKTDAVEGPPTFGRNIRSQEGAAAQPMSAADGAVSAQRTASASSVEARGERWEGEFTARPTQGRGSCARGEGDGAVNGYAYTVGGGSSGSDVGPRGAFAGSAASDQGWQQGEQRHDSEGLRARGRTGSMPSPIDSASHVEDSSGTGTPKHMKSSEKETASTVLSALMDSEFGFVFSDPVDPIRLNLPDYHEIITNPMDLGTIKRKLDAEDGYRNLTDFAADVRLVFDNAVLYNGPAHEVSLEAKILKAIFERDWQKVQPTKENEASNVATPRQNEMSLEAKRLKATFEHGSQEVKRTAERETADGSTTSRLQPCVIPADENDA